MTRVLFIQHGPYAEAYQRFQDGGDERYRDQRASVMFVASLAANHDVVTLSICGDGHDQPLGPRLRSRGMTDRDAADPGRVAAVLDEIAPDLLVLRTPNRAALAWARRRGRRALPVFADFFANDGARALWRNTRLRALLASPLFPCVANHSLNASRSVARALLYPAARVVPWDWSRLPVDPDPRPGAGPGPLRVFFAGALSEPKGVGDLLEAMATLRRRGVAASLTVAGGGATLEAWRGRASALGLGDTVAFLGMIGHDAVRAQMRKADAVVTPSRHDYPEGLPNVIYEALAARAPLVVSDHPAFRGRLRPGSDCLEFPARDAGALADRLAALAQDPALGARLSCAGAAAHDALYVGAPWTDLISWFLDDPEDRGGWVERASLASIERGPHQGPASAALGMKE